MLELEVITGTGQRVTCSPERHEDLFRMMLAGLGQCGIIVRARLRLVQAPEHVEMRAFTYDDVASLLMDQERLTAADALGPLGGTVLKEPSGRWRFVLLAGTFLKKTDRENQAPAWLSGLRYRDAAAPVRTPYWDYLDRRTASIAAGIASGRPNPSLAVMQPNTSTLPFLTHVLSTPEASVGIWRIEVFPMITSRFTQPLHKIPVDHP